MKINLYDFDNTIYEGDSSTDFFFYCLKKYPKIAKLLPKIIFSGVKCKLKLITTTELKQVIFLFLKYVDDIDSCVEEFWNTHRIYIKDFYLAKKHDNDIIISASPEFLLKPICDDLKVMYLIGSRVNKKTGKFTGLNCHDEEKVRRLNKKYDDYEVMEAYSDSKSDIPMLKLAHKSFIVKHDKLIEKKY